MRTCTRQESSFSVFLGPNEEKDEINDDISSIYHSLDILYTKLQRLNFLLIEEKKKGERK